MKRLGREPRLCLVCREPLRFWESLAHRGACRRWLAAWQAERETRVGPLGATARTAGRGRV